MAGFSKTEKIEKTYDVTLPAALKELIKGEAWKRYDGRFIRELPSYESDPHTNMKIRFGDKAVASAAADWDVDWSSFPGHVPLAEITFEDGETDAQFLVVDTCKAACPVLMWEHETGELESVSKSLKAFLGSLVEPD